MYSGHEIFKLVDTHGLPLDIIVLELRDRSEHFNVAEFVQSAVKAGWSKSRLLWMMNISDEKYSELVKKYYDFFKNQYEVQL